MSCGKERAKVSPQKFMVRVWRDMSDEPVLAVHLTELRSALLLACQPTNMASIEEGRRRVLALPRALVLEYIEHIAADAIELTDYWEYRRLLECAALLDAGVVARMAAWGIDSSDPDVREAANDYLPNSP